MVIEPQAIVPIEELTVQLPRNLTLDAVQKMKPELAAARGLAVWQVQPLPTASQRQDQVKLRYVLGDPFEQKITWQGPRQPGANIIEHIDFATGQDGLRTGLWLPGDPDADRNAEHYLVMGMTGTGKSKCWQCIYGEALNRTEFALIYCDPAKGIQTAWPLLDGLLWFEDTEKGTKTVIGCLRRLITERTNYLGSIGLDEWKPGCGLTYLVIHFEEVGGLANRKFIVLAERARSAGISLVLSLQRASGDRMNTSVRYNLGGSMCFGCKDLVDVKMALMTQTIDQGAHPHFWQNRKRGQFYLESTASDIFRYSTPHKVDWIDTMQLQDEVKAGARYRTPVDEVTLRALGSPFAAYRRAVERGDTHWQQVMAAKGNLAVLLEKQQDVDEDTIIEADDLLEPEDNEHNVDKGDEEGNDKLTVEQAEDIVWDWITDTTPVGGTFKWSDLKEAVMHKTDRGETWLSLRLRKRGRLVSEQRICRVEQGLYKRLK